MAFPAYWRRPDGLVVEGYAYRRRDTEHVVHFRPIPMVEAGHDVPAIEVRRIPPPTLTSHGALCSPWPAKEA